MNLYSFGKDNKIKLEGIQEYLDFEGAYTEDNGQLFCSAMNYDTAKGLMIAYQAEIINCHIDILHKLKKLN